jgi:hypothetical protein
MSDITYQQLADMGACADQLEKFRELFGDSVEIAPGLAEYASAFDWDRLARKALPAPGLAEFMRATAPAWAEYERVRSAARAEFERVIAPAEAEYERVIAPAGAEYERVIAPALAKFERVRALAWAEYERERDAALAEFERVCAEAFLRLHMEYCK